ncbi:MAG: hypothetical protein ACK5L0_07345 [Candidatus Fimivivens sp.]
MGQHVAEQRAVHAKGLGFQVAQKAQRRALLPEHFEGAAARLFNGIDEDLGVQHVHNLVIHHLSPLSKITF